MRKCSTFCFSPQGSTVARQASDKEKAKDLPTYKDKDFMKDGVTINIGDDAKEKLMSTLQADVTVSSLTPVVIVGVLYHMPE